MNQYNHGQIAGTLAKLPEIRELKNGAKSIRLTIRNYPDPNDGPEYEANRRAEQDIVVGIYVPASQSAQRYEDAKPGMLASCDFWVESYTYERDGQTRSGQSLNTKEVSLTWPQENGSEGTSDDDGFDYDIYDGYDEGISEDDTPF